VKKPINDIEKAGALQERGDYAKAAASWRRIARAEPEALPFWLRAAECARRDGKPQDAAKTLCEALQKNGAAPEVKTVLKEDAPFATHNVSPSQRDLWIALAESYLETQDWNRCRRVCEFLVKAFPREHYAREMLATALLQSGHILEATSVMRELLSMSPLDALHRFKLATLLQIQGANGQAHREFTRVLAHSPEASHGDFGDEATEAVEILDNLQIRQILSRAGEDFEFGQELLANFDATIEENDFHLSENGLGSLRQILSDGRPDESAPRSAPRVQ
jgi:predicted Zn-dependent protease